MFKKKLWIPFIFAALFFLVWLVLGVNYQGEISWLFNKLGLITGITGFAAFSLTLMLPTRLKFLERWLQGLPAVYFLHHILGIISFEFLLLHPIFLSLAFIKSKPLIAARLLIPTNDVMQLTGWLGLLLLLVVIGTTFLLRLRYEIWRYIHGLTGIAYMLGAIHVLYAAHKSAIWTLVYSSMILPALASYFYWEVIHRLIKKEHIYFLSRKKLITPDILELVLKTQDMPLKFAPGQFVYLSIQKVSGARRTESHPFTIASPPEDQELRILVKTIGDFTHSLKTLPIATKIFIEGPYGRFFLPNKAAEVDIWVAGGIGIVPFLSEAQSAKFGLADLHFFVRRPEDNPFEAELNELARQKIGLRVFTHYDINDEIANILQKIESASGRIKPHQKIYACGPKIFLLALKKQLHHQKFPRWNYRTEEFNWL